MGKFEAKRKKKSGKKTMALLLGGLAVVAVLIVYVIPRVLYRLSGEAETPMTEEVVQMEVPSDAVTVETAEEETILGVEYPMELENGMLVLENLFEFEGFNPDCSNEAGSAIASVTLKNMSEAFLTEAKLTLLLADGSTIDFLVTDLPAGKAAMAFALDNAQMTGDTVCADVSCSVVWGEGTPAVPDTVTVVAEGTVLTITNNTAEEIPSLTVYCRDPFDEIYFGGMAQEYTINNLSANGTAMVEALDSILGLPEVVRVAIHE